MVQCINGKSCSITGTLPIGVILLILKCVIAPSFQGALSVLGLGFRVQGLGAANGVPAASL